MASSSKDLLVFVLLLAAAFIHVASTKETHYYDSPPLPYFGNLPPSPDYYDPPPSPYYGNQPPPPY
ncbi:hypothetical protein E2562_011050 [Oryza meyeriana var. granulata]|uniref:Extensin domain-containing protein n=1 Tax=Oryza meyeriana var. granulata TaxID=110450 RepID=A0A6G1EWG4_9ORYZ|nr:hypothetical protein E2562_011050 [Oryza meyeriana var. granulata]